MISCKSVFSRHSILNFVINQNVKCFVAPISVRNNSTDIKQKKIGIIGMGQVGNALTTNLLKHGYNVTTVLDTNVKLCELFPQCAITKSPKEVAISNDIILSGLPKPANVKAVFEGENGLYEGLSEGKIWVDHSTTDYEQMMQFNELVKGKKAHVLEAPITGGLEALKKGQMTVFMAGEQNLAEQLRPLMKACFQTIIYTGEFGTAMIPKVLSNMLTVVEIIALGECLMIAKRAGLDMKTFWDCIRASAGNSFVWETGGPMVMQGTYDPSFTIDLQSKDNQLGYEMAKKYKVPIELLGHAQQILHRAMYSYGEDAPCYSAPRMLEEALKTDLRCEDFKDWSYSIESVDGSSIIRHHGIKLDQSKDDK